MKSTRRKFFRVLFSAVATVPILLAGRAQASQPSALEQDRISVDFNDLIKESDIRWIIGTRYHFGRIHWIDSDYIRFINTQNVKMTIEGSWVEFTLPPDVV